MQMEYVIGALPDQEQTLALYRDAGWLAYTEHPETLMQALKRSLYLICAYENGKLCGLLRAVGDGLTILYIQDILVLKTHRRQGVGRAMVGRLLADYPHVRQRVLLTDDTPEMHGFYESLGFSPVTQLGLTAFYYLGKKEE